jgi:hypothetical protein
MYAKSLILGCALLVPSVGCAQAGPCTNEIDSLTKTLAARDAGAGPTSGTAGIGSQAPTYLLVRPGPWTVVRRSRARKTWTSRVKTWTSRVRNPNVWTRYERPGACLERAKTRAQGQASEQRANSSIKESVIMRGARDLRNGNRHHLCRGSGIDRNEADEATGRVD